MPATIGFNHVATLTTDMDLTVRFYEQAFEAVVTHTIERSDDHPYIKILDLGGGAALNVFEDRLRDLTTARADFDKLMKEVEAFNKAHAGKIAPITDRLPRR